MKLLCQVHCTQSTAHPPNGIAVHRFLLVRLFVFFTDSTANYCQLQDLGSTASEFRVGKSYFPLLLVMKGI